MSAERSTVQDAAAREFSAPFELRSLDQYAARGRRNTDGAVNALLETALSYVNREVFQYGNHHTLFNTDSTAQNGKFEIDCSSFVAACLQGITFGNSKYLNHRNFSGRAGIELPAEYHSQPSIGIWRMTLRFTPTNGVLI